MYASCEQQRRYIVHAVINKPKKSQTDVEEFGAASWSARLWDNKEGHARVFQ